MEEIFYCPYCHKEIDLDNPEVISKWYDDDEDENGNHKWDVDITCPYCKEEFLEEIWDDAFGESLEDDCK